MFVTSIAAGSVGALDGFGGGVSGSFFSTSSGKRNLTFLVDGCLFWDGFFSMDGRWPGVGVVM